MRVDWKWEVRGWTYSLDAAASSSVERIASSGAMRWCRVVCTDLGGSME